MLKHLHIRNYALIREQQIDLKKGLVILTGETGSGKSILLGALNLIMGARADTKAVFNPEQKCIVEAQFDISTYALKELLEELDIDDEPELIIRREIAPGGKSRAFVNDSPVSVSAIQQICARLVDLHQQFDTMDLVNANFQLEVLDALAGCTAEREEFGRQFTSYQKMKSKLELLSQEEKRALAEREFLQFQLDELLEAKFIEGEQENLEAELNTLTHAEDIKSLSRATLNILNESDFAAIQTLSEIRNNLQQIGKIYPQAESFAVRVESALIELQELSRDLERIEENVDLDPSRLDWVQQRITILYRLLKKHQVENLDALLVIQEELKKQTSRFDSLEGERAALEIECSNMLAELDKKAKMLNQKRQSIAPELEKNVQNALSKLNMAQAKMQIEIKTGVLQRSGKDEVRFLFSTNKGSAFLPMKDIASGGELSRIALCIKSLVAKALSLPTMIFDEIDTGVSGQVALQMGHMLKSLAENQQVIVITHTPQVAARANQHLVVYKTETADQQESRVIEIEAEDRIKHIAIMLSTNPPSTSAIANARELVSLTQN